VNWTRRLLFILTVNFLVFLILLACVAFVPPAAIDIYRWIKLPNSMDVHVDPRSALPNYRNHPWARKHFDEFSRLQTTYHDFIVWRRKQFQGETINIDIGGFRRHQFGEDSSHRKAVVWLFGGSSMFGTGARDSDTIPAYLQKNTRMITFNFGESGYTAHQSLNLLMKAYVLGGRPSHVIFYDGVNDVAYGCRSELTFFSTAADSRIRILVSRDWGSESMFRQVFSPTIAVFQQGWQRMTSVWQSPGRIVEDAQMYDCHLRKEKARLVANALILDWITARSIVERYGGTFHPIMQPVAYLGTPNLTYLKAVKGNALLRQQYVAVYSEIIRQLKKERMSFLDLRNIFDGTNLFYIDDSHVSPVGNEKVATEIGKQLGR